MKHKVFLVTSDQLGKGDPSLGEAVMENLFVLLKQEEELPHAIFLMNRGVLLATPDSFVSPHLKDLEEKGVAVLVCKTCAEHYEVAEALAAGNISSMKHFLELASKYEVITIT